MKSEVAAKLAERAPHPPGEDVNELLTQIMEAVLPAVNKHVPKAKPSPYAKRWWTKDLSQMRRDYSHYRNRARAARRAGDRSQDLELRAAAMKKEYHQSIRKQKRTH